MTTASKHVTILKTRPSAPAKMGLGEALVNIILIRPVHKLRRLSYINQLKFTTAIKQNPKEQISISIKLLEAGANNAEAQSDYCQYY